MATKRKNVQRQYQVSGHDSSWKRTSKEAAVRQFRVDPHRIRKLCAQKDALEKN